MNTSSLVSRLCWLIAALALVAAGVGVLWQEPGSSVTFVTARGEAVELYGRGLYRFESLLAGAGHRGTDAVTLALAIPLLLGSAAAFRRGSARGSLLLVGMLCYFLYVYGTMALGAAYNPLFLVYVALFGASLFAFVLAFNSALALGSHFSERLPRRGIAAFLFASGAVTLLIWLEAPAVSLLTAQPPTLLTSHTTLVTHALDLAIIVPAVVAAGVMLLRNDGRGYVVAFPLLVLIVMLVPVIVAQTISQLSAGVVFTTPEIVGPIGGFLTLGVVATWILVRLIRDLREPSASPTAVVPRRAVGI